LGSRTLGIQEAMLKFAVAGKCWQGYFLDADLNVLGIFEADEKAGHPPGEKFKYNNTGFVVLGL
jgi:CubicO group peptidase (beta-lactamase class C family)